MRPARIQRRTVLSLMAGGAAATAAALAGAKGKKMLTPHPSSILMPTIFLAHGSPLLLDDALWVAQLKKWADGLPRPRAVLMVSAHWEENPPTLSAVEPAPLVYDFSGFPDRFYQLRYPAPPAPALAARVRELLSGTTVRSSQRGLDHGAYIPLMGMYPEATLPVVQLSLPTLAPQPLFALGQRLAPLRKEGVLIVGSGFITHNLRLASWGNPSTPPPTWAKAFDAWNESAIAARDIASLLDYQKLAPGVSLALPTHEHYAPLFATLGASSKDDPVQFPITGFLLGSLTKRSVQWG